MPQKKTQPVMTPALKYFFASLEKGDLQQQQILAASPKLEEVLIDEIEAFVRALKTQNIFIRTVGMSGKRESTILSKAIFSFNKVIKIYYSTSFDENDTGFIRVLGDDDEQQIVVDRLHGYRSKPERIYSSADQCHIIRYITQWLMKRIDWDKTKIHTLELYDHFVEAREIEREEKMFAEETWMEAGQMH